MLSPGHETAGEGPLTGQVADEHADVSVLVGPVEAAAPEHHQVAGDGQQGDQPDHRLVHGRVQQELQRRHACNDIKSGNVGPFSKNKWR